MNNTVKPLCSLCCGECGIVSNIMCGCQMKRRFEDLGIIKGTKISNLAQNAYNDFGIYLVRGAMIAIRCDDARNIFVI